MKKISFFAALILIFSLKVFSQNPPDVNDDDEIKISTTLIQVDVSVTDKKGNIVTDLKPEDFEVYENGKKQDITNFSFIFQGNKIVKIDKSEKNKVDKKNILPAPTVKLQPGQVKRTYALVVDDLGISFENVSWTQRTLRKFVNEQMQDGDLVAIIRTGSGIGALQSFTSDKRQLLAAVDKIKWNAYGRGGIGSFEPIGTTLKEDLEGTTRVGSGESRNPEGADDEKAFQKQIDAFRSDNFSVGTLGALSYVIRGMKQLPGRKSIMLFSEGFALPASSTPNRVLDSMRVLADMANRSSVVIYTLDPRGLQNPLMITAADKPKGLRIDSNGSKSVDGDEFEARATTFRETQTSLRFLAYETGGIPFVNQNDLSLGLERAINDQTGYYLLGYEPDETTFDPKKNKFNKLEVKLLRPGLKIRYRSGFFGITDEKINDTPKTPQQKLLGALVSPFGANDINLNLYPVFQNDVKNGNIIQALVYIDVKGLNFSQEANQNRKANFDLIAMTFGDNGTQVDQLSKNYTIEISEKVYQNMLKNGFVYTLSVPVKKAGAYQFRIALRDTKSEKIGSVSQFVEVPNIKKRLVLSNIILDDFTSEEWQKVRLGGNRDESERSVLLDTTLRQFKRETILRYDYMIYNPKSNQQIKSQLRLIRDGKIVYEEPFSPVKIEGQTDLTRIQNAGALTLGKNLETGDYILQIIATDDETSKNVATQFVEFEIVE